MTLRCGYDAMVWCNNPEVRLWCQFSGWCVMVITGGGSLREMGVFVPIIYINNPQAWQHPSPHPVGKPQQATLGNACPQANVRLLYSPPDHKGISHSCFPSSLLTSITNKPVWMEKKVNNCLLLWHIQAWRLLQHYQALVWTWRTVWFPGSCKHSRTTHPTIHSQGSDPSRISSHQTPNGHANIPQEWTQLPKELWHWSPCPWPSDHGMVGGDLSWWETKCSVWGADRDLFPYSPHVMVTGGEGAWKATKTSWVHCRLWLKVPATYPPITDWVHSKCTQIMCSTWNLWEHLCNIWNVTSTCTPHLIPHNS